MKLAITLCAFVLAIALPVMAAADCCDCCCSDEEDSAMEVSKATAPAVPKPEDMQTFDGSVAPSVVELQPVQFAIYKGSLTDPKSAILKMVELAGKQGLFNGHNQVWSFVPLKDGSQPPAATMEYWPGASLDAGQHASGELEDYTMPGGKYALAANRGAYEQLPETWMKFAAFIGHNAHVDYARPSMEFYYSDPGSTKPEDVITLLYIPIK